MAQIGDRGTVVGGETEAKTPPKALTQVGMMAEALGKVGALGVGINAKVGNVGLGMLAEAQTPTTVLAEAQTPTRARKKAK